MTAVITGVGAVSAFGEGAQVLFDALVDGRSGIGRIEWFDASTFPTQVAGEVPVGGPLDAAWLAARLAGDAGTRVVGELDRRGAVRDRKVAFALLAAAEAWLNAGCTTEDRGATLAIALGLEQAFLEDFGPIFGREGIANPTSGGVRSNAERCGGTNAERCGGTIDWTREPEAALPPVRFRAPVDLAARGVQDLLGLRGPVIVNVSACAAGTLAVAHAASLIERGAASIVLCGAADSMVNPLGLGGMCRLGAPSPRSEPDACRPFDRRRDGLVIGEGAAMFVVEDAERAHARGAQVLAHIAGWASTQDAYRVTAPRPDGGAARAAIERALARAGLPPEAIGYINAHGTGTPLNDPAECLAIHGALRAHAERVPVSSIKGAVGHLMAAAGALELAASLLVFERDLLPGTAHHVERDPACNIDVITEPRAVAVDALLSNSFGFGGQNCTVVLTR